VARRWVCSCAALHLRDSLCRTTLLHHHHHPLKSPATACSPPGRRGEFTKAKVALCIHNIAFQGRMWQVRWGMAARSGWQ